MNKLNKGVLVISAAIVIAGVSSSFRTCEVKADAAIKTQVGVDVRSAQVATENTIKVPDRTAIKQKADAAARRSQANATYTANRGGNDNSDFSGGTQAVSASSSSLVQFAAKYVGYPYIYGASGPRAFDCSGFTSFVYRQYGISIPRTSQSQFGVGQAVSKGNLQPGDLVFFYGGISHVGIYAGGGNFIHAANSRTGVTISNLNDGFYAGVYKGARRISR